MARKPQQESERPQASPTDTQNGDATFDVAFPPPAEMPASLLEGAALVVRTRARKSNRRRAGYAFGDQERLIPLAELDDAKQKALAGDPALIVKLRLQRQP